jgi:hypothetical protein
VARFSAAVAAFHAQGAEAPEQPDEQWFSELAALLTQDLPFTAIYVIVDGVDAWQSTSNSGARQADVVAGLVEQAQAWAERGIYVKVFMPCEGWNQLAGRMARQPAWLGHAHIAWSRRSLVEVITSRLFVASAGRVPSLSVISNPELSAGRQSAELTLVSQALPLPREVISLVREVLAAFARRAPAAHRDDMIEPGDVQAGVMAYSRSLKLRDISGGPASQRSHRRALRSRVA